MTRFPKAPTPPSGQQWDKESLFEQIEKTCTPDVANLLTAVYRQAEEHPAFAGFYFGEGKKPSATAWFNVGEDESAAIWSIYTDEKKSVLAVNFQWMRDRRALAKRLAPLAETLSGLPGLHDLPRSLVAKNYMRRPSLGVPTLSAPDAQEVFLKASLVVVNDPDPSKVNPGSGADQHRNEKSRGSVGECGHRMLVGGGRRGCRGVVVLVSLGTTAAAAVGERYSE